MRMQVMTRFCVPISHDSADVNKQVRPLEFLEIRLHTLELGKWFVVRMSPWCVSKFSTPHHGE
jgi:hypothetical protein